MKKTPDIKVTLIEPCNDGKPFLKLKRNMCRIEYPDGFEKHMVLDSIERIRPDAVTIIPYTFIDNNPHVWLRSAIRTGAAIRHAEDPQFESNGILWELPAGLIDEGETPVEAASRECFEEVGFTYPVESFTKLGKILSMPALLAEILYFYSVLVDNDNQTTPTEDGSPLEYGGELTCVPLSELLQLIEEEQLLDMKTQLGLILLRNKLGM